MDLKKIISEEVEKEIFPEEVGLGPKNKKPDNEDEEDEEIEHELRQREE